MEKDAMTFRARLPTTKGPRYVKSSHLYCPSAGTAATPGSLFPWPLQSKSLAWSIKAATDLSAGRLELDDVQLTHREEIVCIGVEAAARYCVARFGVLGQIHRVDNAVKFGCEAIFEINQLGLREW